MTKTISSFLLASILLLFSCVSAEKALDKGNNKDAVWKALDKLEKKPKDSKSLNILEEAYPLFLSEYKQEIADLENSYEDFKWEKILDRYETMEEAYRKVREIPTARRSFPDLYSYGFEIQQTEGKVLVERYEVGMELLAQGERQKAREAFDHFTFIMNRDTRYKDVSQRLEEARDLATVFVGIAPVEVPSFRYDRSAADFEYELTRRLSEDNRNDFVQYVLPTDRNFPVEDLNHIVQMRFDNFRIDNGRDREQIFTRRRDNVATEEIVVGDSTIVRPVSVEAEVHCFSREIVASGDLEIQILDQNTNRIEERDRFNGNYTYLAEWGYFEGDSRALDSGDTQCMERRSAPTPPREEELFVEFTVPIYEQVLNFLEREYRNY